MRRWPTLLSCSPAVASLAVILIGCGKQTANTSEAEKSFDRNRFTKPTEAQLPNNVNLLFPFPQVPSNSTGVPATYARLDTAGGLSPSAATTATSARPAGPFGVRQITLGLNDLHQAGRLLLQFYYENNGWPRNDAELQMALRELPQAYKAIQSGDYIFVPAKNPNLVPQSHSVIICERLPDKSGIRLVLFGDGSVKRLTIAEFNQLKLFTP